MKEDTKTVSRRRFLTKSAGAAAAVTASILVIETPAATNAANALIGGSCPTQTPFDCNAATTVTNKIIPSISNILGTDYVNVREFEICGTDITDALNCAIDSLKNAGAGTDVPRGGQILIPRGRWQTRGGHDFFPSISIEGVGTQIDPEFFGVPWGTELELVPADEKGNFNKYMFRIIHNQHNCSLKNLSINISASDSAIGLLMTDGTTSQSHLKYTAVENVNFTGGAYGIQVYSDYNFECIQHRFERIVFAGCQTSFYNNTVNCGYSFDTCYFLIPEDGIGLDIVYAGNLAVEHCLFVPSGESAPNSTVLKTTGAFNSISFYNCQDEGITYAYQNTVNFYDYISVVYRNCLIQSKFKFTASGSVLLDSCRAYSFPDIGGAFEDTSSAYVKVYLKGQYNFFTYTPTPTYSGATIATFNNDYSRLIIESNEIGLPEIVAASASVPPYYQINKTRGLINIDSGSNYIVIYNNLVSADSMVFAQLQTYDSGGARIREVVCSGGIIQINLTANASNKLRVAFRVEY